MCVRASGVPTPKPTAYRKHVMVVYVCTCATRPSREAGTTKPGGAHQHGTHPHQLPAVIHFGQCPFITVATANLATIAALPVPVPTTTNTDTCCLQIAPCLPGPKRGRIGKVGRQVGASIAAAVEQAP